MSKDNPKEIVILSDCSQEYKAGLEVYKIITKDTDFEGPREIHPTKVIELNKKQFKIHFFAIQDSYWPAISNICRHCEGAAFVIDLEDYSEERGIEFIKEWLINLEDLDKSEMKTVIIGVTKKNSAKTNGVEDMNKIEKEKNIKYYEANIGDTKEAESKIKEAFNDLAKLIDNEHDNNARNEGDEEMDEYLDKYKNF